ncbi:MAG: acyltransferase [Rhizomicrobium sp.]|jgi:peptidoglycan/LPS O-acetylase OafA/YrhL
MTPFKSKRLYSIDAFRGLAAMGVVVWHWQHFYAISGNWQSGWNRVDQPFFNVLKPLYEYGWMAVDLFFAVSGFVFFWLYLEPVARREIGAGKFALQRLSRLYPIYLLTLLIAAGLEFTFHRATGSYFIFDASSISNFIKSLFLAQQWLPVDWPHSINDLFASKPWLTFDESQSFNGPAWAVSIEVLLYILFFAGAWLRFRGLIFAGLMVVIGAFMHPGNPLVTSGPVHFFLAYVVPHDGQIARGIMGFFMGGLVFYATAFIARQAYAKPVAIIIALAALLAWIVAISEVYIAPVQMLFQAAPAPIAHFYVANSYQIYLFGFILIVAPLTLMALALHEELFGGPYARFTFLGDISYSTYMVHFPMQLTLALLALHFGWKPKDFMTGVAMILFYGAMILVGALSYNYFERPMQALLRGRTKSVVLVSP